MGFACCEAQTDRKAVCVDHYINCPDLRPDKSLKASRLSWASPAVIPDDRKAVFLIINLAGHSAS